MSIAAQTEADLTVTGINNLLLRHYEPGWRHRFLRRPSCALYYILSGELTVVSPEGEQLLTEGDVGIFDADIPMTLENRGTGISASYQISFFADRNPGSLGLPTVLSRAEDLRTRFAAAYEGFLARDVGYRIRARAAVSELIATLLAKQAGEEQRRSSRRLATLLDYIQEHCAEELSLSQLSRIGGYSPSHLRELFREELGLSPVRYINRLRIERASALLHEDLPIWRVGELVGFPNANYFSRIFRAECGMTPLEYRRTCL
jgi:AraC-like DNA-binding protein